MTCKDCKHFYEREPKPWRDIFDLGYCDHTRFSHRYGSLEINMECPVNYWCDKQFEPKEDSWESVSK